MATSKIHKADLIVVTTSQMQSVAPGSGTFYLTPTIPSGYNALGVVGFEVNYAECSVNMCYWDGTQIRLQVRNNYSSALSVGVSTKLLCYKG